MRTIDEKLKEHRNQICNIIEIDIRSLFEIYANSLFDYLHWNKNNFGKNVKLYNNFKRIIQNRKVKVLKLFDERLQKIRGYKMNTYAINKVKEAMEKEIKECFQDMVRECHGGSVENLKENLFRDIWQDDTIFCVISRYFD